MRWFRDLPLKRKLMLVIFLTSAAVLLLACAALMVDEVLTFRQDLVRDVTVLADVLAKNTTAALAFQNETDAQDTLAALRAEAHIVAACLYAKDGRRFAHYVREGNPPQFPAQPGADGHRFDRDRLALFRPVHLDQHRIGTIYLQA